MAIRALLHYALEVPDQTVGQRYYQDFGQVGDDEVIRLLTAAG